jgi:cysteine desulfurase family protein (TIGR01976 family)
VNASDLPTVGDADRARVRAAFPALAGGPVFLENAGGSQVPRVVADAIRDYMLESYVQLGAGYERSRTATAIVDAAHAWIERFVRARRGRVILGSSTTSLLHVLSDCYARVLEPGRNVVLAQTGHEANMGPWRNLARHGIEVRIWAMDPATFTCPLSELERHLDDRTALVAFPHVSNLLGEIVDVAAITERVHEAGARVVVDGVAYAPHRRVDCDGWNVDWYAYSAYKVYGPHMAALYGRADALAELTGPNHFFIADDDVPYKFELGGPSHEGCAGLLALEPYLAQLLGTPETEPLDDASLDRAFALMTALELEPTRRLIEFLDGRPKVRVIGPDHAEPSRVGTVSFVHAEQSSRAITEKVDASDVAIRHGHMYAYDLCRGLGLDPDDGVVRVSLVHYNTPDEIDRLIEVLDPIL